MPSTKLTMIFQVSTQPSGTNAIQRTAGWTESVYGGELTSALRNDFRKLQRARAAMLPAQAAIIGQRFQVVLPTGGSSTTAERFPGQVADANNESSVPLPSDALLIKSATVAANSRNTILRCWPEVWQNGGEVISTSPVTTALANYFAELRGFAMLGRDLTSPREPIFDIEGTTLSFGDPTILTVPGLVRISRAKDTAGVLRSATVKVTAALTSSTYTIAGWPYGDATGGQARDTTTAIYAITNSSVSRLITRKVGRPLFVFRGRRSKRRG